MIVEMRIGFGTFLHMVTIVMHVTMRILCTGHIWLTTWLATAAKLDTGNPLVKALGALN